ncbi:MAG TPA: HEAT repeat domain-containing protein, partial [Thermodesulfobacteriota bacterium]|nr:HEAT repeat domain-containing protein [Thermodesulfobacteriota bacterium]
GLALDTRLLSDFIFELTISRRCVNSYPKGHPIIQSSVRKVLDLLVQLLDYRREITLGVARDMLIFEQKFLDQKNPVYRDYARILFSRGIATITFEKDVGEEELLTFNEILSRNRESLRQDGGIEKAVLDAGIRNIQVKTVSYDLLRVVEDIDLHPEDKAAPTLWESFALHLLDGTLDPRGRTTRAWKDIDPEILAQAINEKAGKAPSGKESTYEQIMASYIGGIFGNERDPAKRKAFLAEVSRLVANLNPELRSRLLTDTFKSLSLNQDMVEEVLAPLPEDVVLETLGNMNCRNLFPSPFILKLLQKLGNGRQSPGHDAGEKSGAENRRLELVEKLSVVLREDAAGALVPGDYQEALNGIISAEKIPGADPDDIERLKSTLEEGKVNRRIAGIVVEIFKAGPKPETLWVLRQQFADIQADFVRSGDFAALNEIHGAVTDGSPDPAGIDSPVANLLTVYENPEFIDGVLAGLSSWGKEKFPSIRNLIQKVGRPFVDPVLDLLAQETSQTLRHFFLETLLGMGEAVRQSALSRLDDSRWYFQRNLILILRSLGDPAVLPRLKAMLGNSHPRVREEVFKALFQFQEAEADSLLLQDLASGDKTLRSIAIRTAEHSQSPEVLDRLLAMLNRRAVWGGDFHVKREIIRTLAKIGNPEAIPSLNRILRSKSFLFRGALTRLKAEVLRSLEFYPAEEAAPIVANPGHWKKPELALAASRLFSKLRGDPQ